VGGQQRGCAIGKTPLRHQAVGGDGHPLSPSCNEGCDGPSDR
jgi:hypothetical protein